MLTKQEILLGKGTRVECSRVREPRRAALPMARSLGFYADGIISGRSLANYSNSGSFLMAHASSAKMGASERDSGKWTDRRCLL